LLGLEEYGRRRADRLSLGNKQRLALARAVLGEPDLLVLDEPVNGLDPAGIAEIRALLRQLADRGVTVFLSSHLLDEVAQLADRVGVVHRGRLIEEIDNPALRGAVRLGIEVGTDDGPRAQALLSDRYGTPAVTARPDGTLVVTDSVADPTDLARLVVGAGIGLRRLVPLEEDLEARFLRLTAEEDAR
jgi:ABC-2 type transport system ATP-binding protein